MSHTGHNEQGFIRSETDFIRLPLLGMPERDGASGCGLLQACLGMAIIRDCNANGSTIVANAAYNNIAALPTQAPDGSHITNGQISSTFFAPRTLALLNTLPLSNSAPLNGFNYFRTNLVNNNLWQDARVSMIPAPQIQVLKIVSNAAARMCRSTGASARRLAQGL